MGELLKSMSIFFSLSFTINPSAPSVLVTVVIESMPASIHVLIRYEMFASVAAFPICCLTASTCTLDKNSTYRAKTMMTLNREKKTDALSLKYRFRFLFTRFFIFLFLLFLYL